jgi:ABC-2 type transport system permease protein
MGALKNYRLTEDKMKQIRKHLSIMLCYFRLNLAGAMEYRASFLTQAFGMALSNSSFIFFWYIAFSQLGGSIAGYSFKDILFIWAVSSSAFGLGFILFANAGYLTQLIVTGELDTFLLQPCSVLCNVICARTNLSAWGDLLYGLVLMIMVYGANGAAWIAFIAGVLIGALVMTAIILCAHSLSFFWGNASMAGQLATEFMLSFSVYPEKIYAPAIRALMYSIIPIGFAVHVPLRLFHSFSPGLAAIALAASLAYCALAGAFFYRGLRRYESGNVIVTRL